MDAERSGSAGAVLRREVLHIEDMRAVRANSAVQSTHRDRAVLTDDMRTYRDRPVKPLWRIVWVVSYAALTA